MTDKRYKPKVDKLFYSICLPTDAFCIGLFLLLLFLDSGSASFIILPALLFVNYFIFSPLFGCVQLRENTVFIKYGFFLKREIEYGKIRALEKKRGIISDSMLSLKNALDHINIKYNSFDVTTVSVVDNDAFAAELAKRCGINLSE